MADLKILLDALVERCSTGKEEGTAKKCGEGKVEMAPLLEIVQTMQSKISKRAQVCNACKFVIICMCIYMYMYNVSMIYGVLF